MVLVREHDELAGDSPGLEDIEHRQALRNWEAVVEFIVDDLNIVSRL